MAAPTPRKFRSLAFFIVVNLLSIVCLVWALHGLHFRVLLYKFAHLHWGWVALAVASNLSSYVVQGWRWSLLLAPVTPIPVRNCIRAVYVGVYANEVLPLRSGEIIRCYLLARSTDMPVSVIFASAVIERIFDGIWLIVAMFVTLRIVQLPRIVRDSGIFLGILILVCGGLLAVAMYWREQKLELLLNARWFGWVHVLIQDLHLIGHSLYLYYAFGLSAFFMFLQVLPIYAVLRAYDSPFHIPMIGALTVAIMLRFNSIVPQAPGNVGTFPGATMLGLRPFNPFSRALKRQQWEGFERISRDFSIILLTVLTVPLLIAGFIAVLLTGMKLGDIHRDAHNTAREREAVPAPFVSEEDDTGEQR